VHYGVLVHEGDVVTVEGEIMHEPKASALSARDRYYIARAQALTTPAMHTTLVSKQFSSTHLPETTVGL